MYQRYFKRLLDIFVALTLIVLLSPVFLVLSLLLAIANNGQPFFFQLRPGKNEKIFRLMKFKTMTDTRDAEGNLLPDHQRITSIGKFVRNSSLDEIPQLLNVLSGHMSLIGPRPLLIEYLPHYNKRQQKRHNVRPGITGWAQVNGRNAISWEQKFEYDVWYVENISLSLDLKILLMTARKVFAANDINFSETITMTKFGGEKEIVESR